MTNNTQRKVAKLQGRDDFDYAAIERATIVAALETAGGHVRCPVSLSNPFAFRRAAGFQM